MKQCSLNSGLIVIVTCALQVCCVSTSNDAESAMLNREAILHADIGTTALARREIRRAGISFKIPSGVGSVSVIKKNDYTRVRFNLNRISSVKIFDPEFEAAPVIWAEFLIYSQKQEALYQSNLRNSEIELNYKGLYNRRIENFDELIILSTPVKHRFNYSQKIFRIDRKDKATGRACRATIVRANYSDEKTNLAEERKIRLILQSIEF